MWQTVTVFKPYLDPKNSPLGPKNIKTTPKLNQNQKVRIEENIENKNCSTTWVDPKTVLSPTLTPKTAL